MIRTVTGTFTYSSQANRDAAKARLEAALAGVPYSPRVNYLTNLGGVVLPTNTTLTISVEIEEGVDSDEACATMFNALIGGTRHTSGWISVNKFDGD